MVWALFLLDFWSQSWALVIRLGLMLHFIVALGIEPSTLDIKLETISVASFHEFGYYYYYDYDYNYYYYYDYDDYDYYYYTDYYYYYYDYDYDYDYYYDDYYYYDYYDFLFN